MKQHGKSGQRNTSDISAEPTRNTRNTSLTFIFNNQQQESLRYAKSEKTTLGLAQKSLLGEKESGILSLVYVGQ